METLLANPGIAGENRNAHDTTDVKMLFGEKLYATNDHNDMHAGGNRNAIHVRNIMRAEEKRNAIYDRNHTHVGEKRDAMHDRNEMNAGENEMRSTTAIKFTLRGHEMLPTAAINQMHDGWKQGANYNRLASNEDIS